MEARKSFFEYLPAKKQAYIHLKVTPGASRERISGFIYVNDRYYLKISVQAPPENNKANIAIIAFLAKQWKIPGRDLEIICGHGAQYKKLSIKNIDPGYLNSVFNNYISRD